MQQHKIDQQKQPRTKKKNWKTNAHLFEMHLYVADVTLYLRSFGIFQFSINFFRVHI